MDEVTAAKEAMSGQPDPLEAAVSGAGRGLLGSGADESRFDRPLAYAVTVIPLIGLAAAVWLGWQEGSTAAALGVAVGLWALTWLGVEVGFHRLFSHNAFQCAGPVRLGLAVLGMMSMQGPVRGAFPDRGLRRMPRIPIAPLQGALCCGGLIPRPSAWAEGSRPFRAHSA